MKKPILKIIFLKECYGPLKLLLVIRASCGSVGQMCVSEGCLCACPAEWAAGVLVYGETVKSLLPNEEEVTGGGGASPSG